MKHAALSAFSFADLNRINATENHILAFTKDTTVSNHMNSHTNALTRYGSPNPAQHSITDTPLHHSHTNAAHPSLMTNTGKAVLKLELCSNARTGTPLTRQWTVARSRYLSIGLSQEWRVWAQKQTWPIAKEFHPSLHSFVYVFSLYYLGLICL